MKRGEQALASLSAPWDRPRQSTWTGVGAGWDFQDPDDGLDLEVGVLRGPILSLDDAIAKLRAVELSFVEGERTDGADASALRETISWLQDHRRAVRVRPS